MKIFNIGNLFLFLLSIWILLCFLFKKFSFELIILGLFSSIFISIITYKLKLINKDSDFYYLNFGFLKHYIYLYFKNFISSLSILLNICFNKISPNILKINFGNGDLEAINISSLNLVSRIIYLSNNNKIYQLYVIDKKNFNLREVSKIGHSINNIEDEKFL